jgi:hypothetical protein
VLDDSEFRAARSKIGDGSNTTSASIVQRPVPLGALRPGFARGRYRTGVRLAHTWAFSFLLDTNDSTPDFLMRAKNQRGSPLADAVPRDSRVRNPILRGALRCSMMLLRPLDTHRAARNTSQCFGAVFLLLGSYTRG